MIQPGMYRARATSGEHEVRECGLEMIGVRFVIASGGPADHNGSEFVWWGSLWHEETLRFLSACGCENPRTLEGLSEKEVVLVILGRTGRPYLDDVFTALSDNETRRVLSKLSIAVKRRRARYAKLNPFQN